ncbi:DUF4393 domain-containing protein [Methylophaga sp.]|uniref:DUF4393 domain-containing protein n=1 Tax=Methylophaga sp. TaxID=2024840 RepID=UPI0014007875|nr:DUF4393 domain-containing protein [Methylophaga sp.]MTI63315.1 DUF4393 domain-containing protein [Methylophaga sp.]
MEILKEIINSPSVFKEIYGDLAKPGVQQAGKALGTILGLGNTALWPIAMMNERSRIKLETNLEKYREKLESVPEDEICEVAPEIGVPIAEKLAYVTDSELSDMYAELLAQASIKTKAGAAHPSFVNVISNMSPDEAILLKSVRKLVNGIPFIEVRLNNKNKKEWSTLDPIRPGIGCLKDLHEPLNIHAYINNFEGIGFFNVRHDIYMVGDNIYEPLETYAKSEFSAFAKPEEGIELKFNRGKIEITPLALMFMNACFEESAK